MYLWVVPSRCQNTSLYIDEPVTSLLCEKWQSFDNLTEDAKDKVDYFCQVWGNTTTNTTNEELALRADIRPGAIQVLSESMLGNVTLENGVTQETNFTVVAKFNEDGTIVTR